MTDEELIEQVARAIDPAAWEVGQPIPTREAVVAYHSARQASIAKARAILPIIKAERIRGGEMVKEAAIQKSYAWCPSHTGLNTVGDWLRKDLCALSVPAIVEAGEHQPKENSNAP